MNQVFISLTAGTDVGRVRTNNEDNFILNKNLVENDWFLPAKDSMPIKLCEEGCLLSVADGMGGLNAGEVASEIAISTVRDEFSKENLKKIAKSDRSIEKFLRKCVVLADENIKKRVARDSSTAGMGTTLVILWICGSKAHIIWCGDSRGYVYNQNSGLRRITKDHSYVQQLVDEGKLRPDLAFDHPESNIITRCLGDFPSKAKPDYNSFDIQTGDIMMICSDGLCGLCRDEEIQQVIRENADDVETCKLELINHAMAAGGYDNCTVSICKIEAIGTEAVKPVSSNKIQLSTINEFADVKISSDVNAESDESSETIPKEVSETATVEIAGTATSEDSELTSEAKTEPEAEPEPETETEPESESESEPESDSESESKPDDRGSRTMRIIVAIAVLAVVAVCVLKYFDIL